MLIKVAEVGIGNEFAGGVAVAVALAVAVLLGAGLALWRRGPVGGSSSSGSGEPTQAGVIAEAGAVLDGLPDAVLGLGADGRIIAANARAEALTGRSAEALVGRRLLELVGADGGVERLHSEFDAPVTESFELVAADGRTTLVEATRYPTGRGSVAVLRDVTSTSAQRVELADVRRRFQLAFQSAPTGMAMVRVEDGTVLEANDSLAAMLGRSIDELVGRTLNRLVHPDDVAAVARESARLQLGIASDTTVEQRFARPNGEYIWARTRVALTDDGGTPLAVTHVEDITEQRRATEQLTHAATHDSLTQLPNRSSFVRRLDAVVSDAEPDQVVVMFIDLDNFKVVNDSLGHTAGDVLLREIAARFRGVLRRDDVLARFGGDEFVVMLDGRRAPLDPAVTGAALLSVSQEPVVIDGHEVAVSASIGYAYNTESQHTAEELLRDADAAMYRAKGGGRGRVVAFVDSDRHASINALRTSSELRRGLARGEVVPYFQPIVELSSGRTIGMEVLARWLHPERGLLMPDAFIPMADSSGLVVELGARMLRDALAQLAKWRVEGSEFASCFLSVNVATQQVTDRTYAAVVADALAHSGIEADSLWLELTETTLMSSADVAHSLRVLRGLGVHLSVDDFGTGYSSLTYLKQFPVEAIKIDRSFVNGLGLEHADSSIVQAVVALGHSLGLKVTAEGIATPLQLSRLLELGCDLGQGYLFGRARPASLLNTPDEALDSAGAGARADFEHGRRLAPWPPLDSAADSLLN